MVLPFLSLPKDDSARDLRAHIDHLFGLDRAGGADGCREVAPRHLLQ